LSEVSLDRKGQNDFKLNELHVVAFVQLAKNSEKTIVIL